MDDCPDNDQATSEVALERQHFMQVLICHDCPQDWFEYINEGDGDGRNIFLCQHGNHSGEKCSHHCDIEDDPDILW